MPNIYIPIILKNSAPKPTPTPIPNLEGRTPGIDVSHYQPTIEYQKVAFAGYRFAYVKASEGMLYRPSAFKDSKFDEHFKGFASVGIYRGAYHFARPQYDCVSQAKYFAPLAIAGDLPPALDLEDAGGLDNYRLTTWVLTFMSNMFMMTGRYCILYTNGYFASVLQRANNYHLWISQPLKGGLPNPATSPSLPMGWTDWKFFQYSWVGTVPGITNYGLPCKVDLNWFHGDEQTLKQYADLY